MCVCLCMPLSLYMCVFESACLHVCISFVCLCVFTFGCMCIYVFTSVSLYACIPLMVDKEIFIDSKEMKHNFATPEKLIRMPV